MPFTLDKSTGQRIMLDANGNPISGGQPSTTSSTISNPTSQQPWTSGNGIVDTAVDWLPTIGAVVGGVAGTPLDLVSGPAGNIIGAGAGGAAGEALKEKIKGESLSAGKIAGQGALGAAGEGIGQAVAPIAGKALGYLADKLPVVGPAIGGLSNLGETSFAKVFGAGDTSTVEGGVNGLVKTAKEFGLTKLGSINAIRDGANTALDKAGQTLGDTLAQADSQGAGITYKEVLDILDNATPKVGVEKKTLTELMNSVKTDIVKKITSGTGEIVTDNTLVPSSILNDIKISYADLAKFGKANPTFETRLYRGIATGFKDAVEDSTKDIVDIGKLNQDWWNLKQITTNLGKTANRALGGVRSALTPTGILRTPSTQLAIGQAGENLPRITGQVVLQNNSKEHLPTITGSNANSNSSSSDFSDYPQRKETYSLENLQKDILRDPQNKAYYESLYSQYAQRDDQEYQDAVDLWKLQHPKQSGTQPGLTTILNRAAGSVVSNALPNLGQ